MKPLRPLALAALAAGVMATVAGSLPRPGVAQAAESRIAPYRLRLGSAGAQKGLEHEIAFLVRRVQARPDAALARAALAGAYLARARASGEAGWYLLAEQQARRSLALRPALNPDATMVLARVAIARHDFLGAMRLLQAVKREDPAHEGALAGEVTTHLALGRPAEAARAAEALVARRPGVESFTQRALALQALGRDEAAVEDFRRGLALEQPGEAEASAQARAWLGRLYSRRGLPVYAEGLYREALRIAPGHPSALGLLADLETRRGDHAAAAAHYAQAFVRTQAPLMLLREAAAREALGQGAEAAALRDRAERSLRKDLASGTFGHRRDLARLLLERGQAADDHEALALLREEAQGRQDPETLYLLGWALGRAARWPEARQALRAAIRSGPPDAGVHARASLVEQRAGRPEAAAAYLRAASAIDPGFATSPAVVAMAREGLVLPAPRAASRSRR